MKPITSLLLIAAILAVSGCATYKYEHISADGSSCTISTSSARDFEMLKFGLSENCAIVSGADSIDSTTALLGVLDKILQLVPKEPIP